MHYGVIYIENSRFKLSISNSQFLNNTSDRDETDLSLADANNVTVSNTIFSDFQSPMSMHSQSIRIFMAEPDSFSVYFTNVTVKCTSELYSAENHHSDFTKDFDIFYMKPAVLVEPGTLYTNNWTFSNCYRVFKGAALAIRGSSVSIPVFLLWNY